MGRPLLAFVTLMSLLTVGCSDDEPSGNAGSSQATSAVTADELDGKTFVSTTATGHDLVAGNKLSLSFEGDEIQASAGCNAMGGSFAVTNGTLVTGSEWASTARGCEPDLMAQDDWVHSFLAERPTVSIDGDSLTLTSGAVSMEMVDETVADPARPLVGTAWTLDTIIEDETASSVPTDVERPTLLFRDDGGAEWFDGCNWGSTKVELDGATVVFGGVTSTLVGCAGSALTVETAVLAVLADEVTIAIEGPRLTLTKGDQGLVYRAD